MDLQDLAVRHRLMDIYKQQAEMGAGLYAGDCGDGVLLGGYRKKKKRTHTIKKKAPSAYNIFVKKYAAKYDISIPDAAYEIKHKRLWKAGSKTPKRKITSRKRRIPKRTTHKRTTKRRTHKRRYGRGMDESDDEYDESNDDMGGATFEELEDYMEKQKTAKGSRRQDLDFEKKFGKIECNRLKDAYIRAPIDTTATDLNLLKQAYKSCVSSKKQNKKRSTERLTQAEKDFLLEQLLDQFNPDFRSFKKKRQLLLTR